MVRPRATDWSAMFFSFLFAFHLLIVFLKEKFPRTDPSIPAIEDTRGKGFVRLSPLQEGVF